MLPYLMMPPSLLTPPIETSTCNSRSVPRYMQVALSGFTDHSNAGDVWYSSDLNGTWVFDFYDGGSTFQYEIACSGSASSNTSECCRWRDVLAPGIFAPLGDSRDPEDYFYIRLDRPSSTENYLRFEFKNIDNNSSPSNAYARYSYDLGDLGSDPDWLAVLGAGPFTLSEQCLRTTTVTPLEGGTVVVSIA